MNKLMTAVLGLSLAAGSVAFAAPKQADNSKMADTTASTSTPKVKKAKKTHVKKHAASTKDTAAPAANPTK